MVYPNLIISESIYFFPSKNDCLKLVRVSIKKLNSIEGWNILYTQNVNQSLSRNKHALEIEAQPPHMTFMPHLMDLS